MLLSKLTIKKKAMKKEFYEFICPAYYLPYIFNADIDGLNDQEIERIDQVLSGYYCFSVKDDDTFFSHKNDFNNFGGNCVTLIALKNE